MKLLSRNEWKVMIFVFLQKTKIGQEKGQLNIWKGYMRVIALLMMSNSLERSERLRKSKWTIWWERYFYYLMFNNKIWFLLTLHFMHKSIFLNGKATFDWLLFVLDKTVKRFRRLFCTYYLTNEVGRVDY